jgi:hypothetical protein
MPEIDFTRHGVLMVEMGSRRTGGYGFDSKKLTLGVSGHTATLELEVREPAPGAPVTQALTAPWAMIQIPLGEYRNIRVIDQHEQLLVELEIT